MPFQALDMIMKNLQIQSRMQVLEMEALEDWQLVLWIPWQHWNSLPMVMASDITMVFSASRSKTAIRQSSRTTGLKTATLGN